jgi:hypothetical protein
VTVQWIAHNGRGRGSKLITRMTRGEVSHVSLRFRHGGMDTEIESIQGRGVHEQVFKPSTNQAWFWFEQTPAQAQAIYDFCRGAVGAKYDWKGIWGFVRRRDIEHPDKWFCSELASEALLQAGIRLLWIPTFKQSPSVATSSPLLRLAPESPWTPSCREG